MLNSPDTCYKFNNGFGICRHSQVFRSTCLYSSTQLIIFSFKKKRPSLYDFLMRRYFIKIPTCLSLVWGWWLTALSLFDDITVLFGAWPLLPVLLYPIITAHTLLVKASLTVFPRGFLKAFWFTQSHSLSRHAQHIFCCLRFQTCFCEVLKALFTTHVSIKS